MAAISITWDPTSPAGGDALNAGDDSIRNFKLSVGQRIRNGGHSFDTTSGPTTTETDGRHACGVANTAGSAIDVAGEFAIFAIDVTTPLFSFRGGTSAAANTAGNTPGELFTTLAIRGGGIVKGVTLSASTSIIPTALADNAVNDNAVDIGVDATNRFRSLFLGSNAKIGGTLLVTGVATFSAVPVFSAGSSFTTLTVTTLLTLSGGQKLTATTVASGSYTVLTTDHLLYCTVTGNTTLNLPTAASVSGQDFIITIPGQAGSANTVSITPNGAEKIDNGGSYVLRRSGSGDRTGTHILSDGTRWTILSDRTLP